MLLSSRRLRRCQFLQLLVTCSVLSLMLMFIQEDNDVVNHIKSYSYRYLINSYNFVNESLSLAKFQGTRNFKYLINNKDKCENEDVLLLLFVKTSPENVMRRNAIRNTWGNENYIRSQHDVAIKIVFALGIEKDPMKSSLLQKKLVDENDQYSDLVQQDFFDTFHNLTLKLILQFRWVNSYCSNAKFIMSADDDIFVHTPNLVSYLKSLDSVGVQDFWIGRVHRGSPPMRNKNSKYYVSYEMYPWLSYPDYTAGAAYVISRDVAAKVYQASKTLNTSLYIDDVFMGLCANKMGIVPQQHLFFSGEGKSPYHPCIYNKMMTSHGHLDDLAYLWKHATDPKVYKVHCFLLLCVVSQVSSPLRAWRLEYGF
uniref:Hexosyltransferase n=1 Tax=Leptobrachium leishanense TaxID=445787 RepID=A0A8C5PAG3_9ANUR